MDRRRMIVLREIGRAQLDRRPSPSQRELSAATGAKWQAIGHVIVDWLVAMGYVDSSRNARSTSLTEKGWRRLAEAFPDDFTDPDGVFHDPVLEMQSYADRVGGRSRGTPSAATALPWPAGSVPAGLTCVPVLRVEIAAGAPLHQFGSYTRRHATDWLAWVDGKPERGRDLFAIRVIGESMIEAHIVPGDTIVLEHVCDADSGDVVAACLYGDEYTLKRFVRQGDAIHLVPANAAMREIVITAEDLRCEGDDSVRIIGRMVGLVRDATTARRSRWN